MLARAGVPGFVLWVLVQFAWLRQMLRRYRVSRTAGQRRWSQLFLFLIAYWLAFLVNASFDVSLEGPMAGIWFWTLFGVGLAAGRIHHRCPAVLEGGGPAGAAPERAGRRPAPAARGEG
jgi:O-antigen ligase